MIDKTRLAILGSVPVVMIINLMLLDRYAGANPIVKKNDYKVNKTVVKEEKVIQTAKPSYSGPIMSSKNKKKFVILYCPPPPPHTLCGPEPE